LHAATNRRLLKSDHLHDPGPGAVQRAQTGGDLNIVVVGWNDTVATVQSVKDSAGNTYTLAIGPTKGTGLQESIYYAANIVGGSNTVTVTFKQLAVALLLLPAVVTTGSRRGSSRRMGILRKTRW
jgi:hypothetical protein